ncbi:hypothetical protein F4680DRAFT_141904 [Xylaria scruposa]|nr:hypothetical protein F4680DRAFT_141904 [Xylaria scruposa]
MSLLGLASEWCAFVSATKDVDKTIRPIYLVHGGAAQNDGTLVPPYHTSDYEWELLTSASISQQHQVPIPHLYTPLHNNVLQQLSCDFTRLLTRLASSVLLLGKSSYATPRVC